MPAFLSLRRRSLAGAALALSLLPGLAAADPLAWRFTRVSDPGALTTALIAVNDRRQVVGVERDLSTHLHHAIVGTRQGVSRLDPDGPIGQATESWAYSINGWGDIAGTLADADGTRHGYLRHVDGTLETIAFPGATGTEAYGVNDRRDLIGLYTLADGSVHAFRRHDGRYENADLPGAISTTPLSINDHGTIVGEVVKTADTLGYGYRQQPGGAWTLHEDPQAAPEETYWISINNRQEVLGSYYDAAWNFHDFVRRGGVDQPFELPADWGATVVIAETLNDLGDVVGYYIDGTGALAGFYATATSRAAR